MSPHYLERLRELLEDPLAIARSAASEGRDVVGYVGDEIPVALILAADAVPVRLRGDASAPTPRADQYLESAHTPELRAIAESWLSGEFDFLKSVVFPRADDSSQRLYYYLCELQRRGLCGGPRPLLYDIAKIPREASMEHSKESTRRLALELGSRDEKLPHGFQRAAERDSLLREVGDRAHLESPLAGSEAWLIRHAAAADWRAEFDADTRQWLSARPLLSRPRRILFAGDAPPSDALHRAIEDAGGSVVLDLTGFVVQGEAAPPASIAALAAQFQARRNPVLAMRDQPAWLADEAARVAADGVVAWLIEEDEAMPWEIARQARALREKNVPTLLLTRQSWIADEQTRDRLKDFVAGIEVKR